MQLQLIGLCLLAMGVQATEIYKSVDSEGRVSYGEEPSPGAVKVERMATPDYTPDPVVQQTAEELREVLQGYDEQRQEREKQETAAKAAAERAAQPTEVIIRGAPLFGSLGGPGLWWDHSSRAKYFSRTTPPPGRPSQSQPVEPIQQPGGSQGATGPRLLHSRQE